jgi:hypothetical protein
MHLTRIALLLVLFSSLFTLPSCNTDADVVPPSVEILSISVLPRPDTICGSLEPTVYRLNDSIEIAFQLKFSDDVALSQYKIDIHNNFDCHGHAGSLPGFTVPGVSNLTSDWSLLSIQPLSGTEQIVTGTLRSPANPTAGAYHFQIQVIDEAGNDIPNAGYASIILRNTRDSIAPQVQVLQPTGTAFTATRGTPINFSGTVTDNYSLSEGGNGVLFLTYTDLNSGNTFTSNQVFFFDNSVGATYPFNFNFAFPVTVPTGNYRVSLRANDGVNNPSNTVSFNVNLQ